MTVEWTGLGPELLLRLDRDSAEPLRAQLEHELREAIRSGRLAPGERLPSSRTMAQELGVSRGLVTDCYTQLQAEGYLTGRTGSATRVAESAAQPAAVTQREGTSVPAKRVLYHPAGTEMLLVWPKIISAIGLFLVKKVAVDAGVGDVPVPVSLACCCSIQLPQNASPSHRGQ